MGGEFNATQTAWEDADLHVCLAFPDLYDLGMSNFALMIFYDILNHHPETLAHRTYLPAPDMIAAMRETGLPLYALEDYRPVRSFDILAISTAYEQLYTNCLELMDLAGLPIRSVDRTSSEPLIIGGGHGTFNPEPIAPFFDAFVIGEAEELIVTLSDTVRHTRTLSREAQLRALAKLPGVYVPRFYQPTYRSSGEIALIDTLHPDVPNRVTKRITPKLPPTPIKQLVPNIDTVHNRAIIEIHRGCTRGCRFCQAGAITRPVRERPVDEILAESAAITDQTGFEEIALLSLSSADYSEIGELIPKLMDQFEDQHISLSLPSLRIDAFSVALADSLSRGRHSGFTFAPEAGSDALRHRINKDISTEALLTVAKEVFKRGWRTLKLYFMMGLPTETDADIEAIIDLAHQVKRIGYQIGGRKTEIHVSVSTFVPKPHTVFQWEPLVDTETAERRLEMLIKNLRGRGLQLSWNPYAGTQLESLLARGDRRLSSLVARAWELGARFDAWDDWRNEAAWEQALDELPSTELRETFGTREGLMDFYLYRRRQLDAPLPWDHLESGIEKRFFLQDYQRSQAGELLVDCREQCHACGIIHNFTELEKETWQCPVLI